jgi:hypothetical protein
VCGCDVAILGKQGGFACPICLPRIAALSLAKTTEVSAA